MTIYLVEEKEEIKLDAFKYNYRWIPRVRATNESLALDKMNELKGQDNSKHFRVVRLIS